MEMESPRDQSIALSDIGQQKSCEDIVPQISQLRFHEAQSRDADFIPHISVSTLPGWPKQLFMISIEVTGSTRGKRLNRPWGTPSDLDPQIVMPGQLAIGSVERTTCMPASEYL